ncbi:MAG: hypothetical protein KKH88_00570 [Nanoarchaeota archaeon]|nr:hypothetical protein [Nanoarchaeota archaeon]
MGKRKKFKRLNNKWALISALIGVIILVIIRVFGQPYHLFFNFFSYTSWFALSVLILLGVKPDRLILLLGFALLALAIQVLPLLG